LIKKVSGTVKLDLAQYYELEAFSQFASELDESTKAQLTRGRRVVESLKQGLHEPYALWQEAIVLYAASKGYFDQTDEKEVGEKIKSIFALIESSHTKLIEKVNSEKKFSEDLEKMMKEILDNFFAK